MAKKTIKKVAKKVAKKAVKAKVAKAEVQLKLDLGCGPNPKEGFEGCDQIKFNDKIKHVFNMGKDAWPFKNDTVDEVNCSHAIEHLTAKERVHFMNELYRVCKKGAKTLLIAPHVFSERAYGDFTHQWPPIAGFWFYYLNKEWRKSQAPHCDKEFNPEGYDCDFEASWGYSLHGELDGRPEEYRQIAVKFWKEAIQDIFATLTKK